MFKIPFLLNYYGFFILKPLIKLSGKLYFSKKVQEGAFLISFLGAYISS